MCELTLLTPTLSIGRETLFGETFWRETLAGPPLAGHPSHGCFQTHMPSAARPRRCVTPVGARGGHISGESAHLGNLEMAGRATDRWAPFPWLFSNPHAIGGAPRALCHPCGGAGGGFQWNWRISAEVGGSGSDRPSARSLDTPPMAAFEPACHRRRIQGAVSPLRGRGGESYFG